MRRTVTLQPELGLYTISNDSETLQVDATRHIIRRCESINSPSTKIISLWGDFRDPRDRPALLEMFSLLSERGYEVRVIGSCVLTNAGVATGQFDGAILFSGHKLYAFPWDLASAHQITAAGGIVTTMHGAPDPLNADPHSMIAACDHQTHMMLQSVVAEACKRSNIDLLAIPDRRLITQYPQLGNS